jgi:PhnB protein
MGVNLNPYLHFDGQAAEAIAFYADVLGGKATTMTFGDMGMEGPDAVKIMHGQLETDSGLVLMLSDMPHGMNVERGTGMTVSLSGDDAATLRRYWEGLSASGRIETPLEKQMWGDEFGQCTDRFGVGWLVNIAGSATG